MAISRTGENAPPRGALHETLLHQIGLDDLLDGVARLAQRRGDGFDPHRPTTEILRNQRQIAAVESVQPARVHFQPGQGGVGDLGVHAFLFGDDLLGLSDDGRYANSAEAVTPVMAYQLPTAKLQNHLRKDAGLEFHVICKLCQELRQAQRHAFLISRRDALPKLAMFLQLLEDLQTGRGELVNEIHLPMDRTEIGEFVGMSLAAVSRGFKKLAASGVIEIRNRQHVKVKDRAAFNELADLSVSRTRGSSA